MNEYDMQMQQGLGSMSMDREFNMMNAQAQNSASTQLQFRLNIEPLIVEISNYLLGQKEVIEKDKDSGEFVSVFVRVSRPLCNDEGYYSIMRTIRMVINNQVVQGNMWDETLFENFMVSFRKDLAMKIAINLDEYGVDINEFHGIMSDICFSVFVFMTRTYNDGERKSYGLTMRSSETIGGASQKQGFLSKIFGG